MFSDDEAEWVIQDLTFVSQFSSSVSHSHTAADGHISPPTLVRGASVFLEKRNDCVDGKPRMFG